ncbi:uncharacterized protein LODBEIA_P56800 [Lodderomyces beijingensis]|uniref:YTH domain-containing protein n=1 Tax=Lodderomyces beijingensis TaxID=1775926 RepID=A0ABP0ZTJ2_9ASCO
MTFWTYKGAEFPVPYSSRFFVIKSYSVMDVHASFEHGIWTSTEMGNRRLDRAFRESRGGAFGGAGKVFLFFSVNASGRFCGVCEMVGAVDFTRSSGVWSEQGKWRGVFAVEWMMVADVPNRCLQHLKVAGNEDRPVTCSRDTQEIPFETGVAMLKIVSSRQGQDL